MIKYLLAFVFLLVSPAWATWTLTQVQANVTCTTTTCAVPVTSTGAHHLLVAGIITGVSRTISGVSAGACNTSWTHAPNTNVGGSSGFVDLYYCADSVSGQTSITITLSGVQSSGDPNIIWEASSSLGTIALDSGGTPSGNNTSAGCTACAGTSLTLSANNNIVFGLFAAGGTASGVTGTGCVNDLSNPGGNGVMHCINVTGSTSYPTTWTQSSSGEDTDAAAFQETSSITQGIFFMSGKWFAGGRFIN